jgi:hypothetical protein
MGFDHNGVLLRNFCHAKVFETISIKFYELS